MDDILKSYIEDLRDNLLVFNESLMMLENDEVDGDVINAVFRVAHTIKGNSAAMEFYKVEKVMHTMEDILFEVREGTRELTQDIVDVMYRCHDFLEDFLEVLLEQGDDKTVDSDNLLNTLNAIKNPENSDVQIANNSDEQSVSDGSVFLLSGLTQELVDLIKKNIEIGLFVNHITVEFSKNVMMKSIRAFMIFQKVESYANILFSEPKMPTEDEFRSGEFDFEGDKLEIIILSEHKIEGLEDELKNEADVENADIRLLKANDTILSTKADDSDIIKSTINEIEICVLGFQQNENNEEIVNKTLESLGKISQTEDARFKLLRAITERLEDVFKYISLDSKIFTADIVSRITIIMQDMKIASYLDEQAPIDEKTIKKAEKNIIDFENIFFGKGEKTGEILKKRGLLQKEEIEEIVKFQQEHITGLKFGQIAVQEGKVSAVEVADVLKEQSQKSKKPSIKKNDSNTQIRVPVAKIDNLMDTLGELVILSAQLEEQMGDDKGSNSKVMNTISRMSKIVRSVQDTSMSLRLIKIKDTLFRLTRVIRDTASELDKKVNIQVIGEDTELDRSAAEKMFDPLMHLVRNAVSHGIETPEERLKLGKPEKGNVTIESYNKRGYVYVEVSDDGKGIDPDKVLKKAIEKGFADPDVEYSESEIINFIMKPGFSTQQKVNNIAGRGVGMNVVEAEIGKLGGKVEIQNRFGNGSTFVVRIPMNLALINGTIVSIDEEKYIIPTIFIQQFYTQGYDNWLSMQGEKRAIKIRDRILPLITPEQVLGYESNEKNKERDTIVVLDMDNKLIAMPVDSIDGRREFVSKPLDQDITIDSVLTGASILGDGNVSLILDIEAIFKSFEI